MSPPKPSSPTTADDERRREAASEADRLGREHSNNREMKARAERRTTGVPGVPGAPVVQPRRAEQRLDGRAESRPPDFEPINREGRTPAAHRPAERVERPTAAEPREQRDRPLARPPSRPTSTPASAPAQASAPHARSSAPMRDEGAQRPLDASIIDDVAVEAEELLRESGTLWRGFSLADKITLASAGFTFVGTMLPWLYRPHEEVVIGLGSGGIVHAVIACLSVWLLVQRDRPSLDDRGLRPTPARQRQRARRTALWMLLLSLASTMAGTWFLLVYGVVRRFEIPTLDIGLGLYVSLAAGLGVSYSGFAFFWRSANSPRR